MDFDYRTATEDEILRRGALLEGSRVGQIPGASFAAAEASRGKGEVGLALEAFFGIPPNPISDADFPGAHIELKAVPVVDTTRGARIKERTFISAINYETLALDDWATASVRKKLHILFVFYEHLRGQPKADFPIHGVLLWRPEDDIEEQISRDWMTVRGKILAGLAHELSEADGRILGPATKGADSSVLRRQPHSSVLAPSRAFALKPAFTFSLYVDPSRARLESAELAENASLVELRRRFGRFIGLSIDAAADALGIRRHRGKGYAGQVIQAAVRASSPLVESDFVVIGPTVRMTRVNGESYPYEALSFPTFRHLDVAAETWDDSELLALIEHMLIVPAYGRSKATPAGECIVGQPIYWEPTKQQLELIESEWTVFHDRIAEGNVRALPTASKTRAIHVRPHALNRDDVDPVPGGGYVPKKSFWLNQAFVQEILLSSAS